MFDHFHYVPILTGKEGEYGALKLLDNEDKIKLTPLWEIPTIPYDFQNDKSAKTIDEHLSKVEERILGAWMFKRPAFIDLSNIYEDEVMINGDDPLDYVFEQARTKQLQLIPVSGLNRAESYQKAVRNACQKDHLGVCLRVDNEDFEDLAGGSTEKEKQISDLLDFWQVKAEETDVILDFRAVTENQSSSLLITAIALISSFPFIDKWRTFTVAATAFPKDLSDIRPASVERLPRVEWKIWNALFAKKDKLPRIPTFGDYAINYPIHSEVDPRIIKMSAGLRYTTDEEWMIFKGRNIQKHGADQFNHFCADLIEMPEYKGKDFSWGDAEIYHLAHDFSATGNATTWRKIAFNHHFALIVNQLANLRDS